MKARVFLSYARADGQAACDFFQEALQNAGYDVWRDVDNLPGGEPWRQKIDDTIRTVDAVLLFLTPGAISSKNVEDEWKTAIRYKKRIVPLIVMQTPVPDDLLSYNWRDIRENDAYQLEPSKVQKDLKEERDKLRDTFEFLKAQMDSQIVDATQQKYVAPFVSYLRLTLAAEPVALPPEVLRMLFSLLQKLIDELVRGHDITPLVESMAAGTYTAASWSEEPIYQSRIGEVAYVLKKVRDAIPSSSVPVIVIAMTYSEAEELSTGKAFDGLPPEWRQEFQIMGPDLPHNWQQRYAATSNAWEPFVGDGSIDALIQQELALASTEIKWPLRASYVEIRDLPKKENRKLLLTLRANGCIVIMDAVSAWHPQLQAAFRATSLDVLSNSLVVRVSPHQTLDSVRNKVGFLLREWLSCEFYQRENVDLDDRCETVMEMQKLRRWIRNRLKQAAPGFTTQKSDLRQNINNFG